MPNIEFLKVAGFSLVALIVTLAIGGQLIGNLQQATHTYETHTEANETFSGVAYNTANSFALLPFNQSRAVMTSVLAIWNSTTNVVETTSYSTTNLTWTVTNQSMENDTEYYVHYIYRVDIASAGFNLSGQGLSAVSTFSDWLTILVVVVIASVVVAILIKGLGGGRT